MNHHERAGIELSHASEADSQPPRKRVLVVDADPSVRQMLTRVLLDEGYSVWAAANGIAALEIAAVANIDVVLLDLNLPDKSGWDTFLRLTSGNPSLIVVVIGDRSNQALTGAGSGVGALFEKPLNFSKLLQAISELLAESAESRRARAADFYRPQPKPREQRIKGT